MLAFVEKLRQYDDFKALKGASLNEIKEAERKLNIEFSDEYKEYLSEYGIATANGYEFTGICQSERLNVVCVTEKERKNVREIPEGAYVVEQTHIDGIVIWQTRDGAVYKSQGDSFVMICDSLYEFIN